MGGECYSCGDCYACAIVCLRECEGDGNVDVWDVEGVVVVRSRCECLCGIRGSGMVSSAYDVLERSVVRGMRGLGEVC